MRPFNNLRYIHSLLRSRKVKRKIVVIESDDWGSERIPSNSVKNKLKNIGVKIDTNPYLQYDTLESIRDIEKIKHILKEVEARFGKKVKISTNFNVANPNYQMIADNNYENYYYESFKETYYNRDGNSFLWEEIRNLIHDGYFDPQFHGREHVNFHSWLEEIKNGNNFYKQAFDLGCYAIDAPSKYSHLKNLMASFEYNSVDHKNKIIESINSGIELFRIIFKKDAKIIVPTRHVWDSELEEIFTSNGLKNIQTSHIQLVPHKNGYLQKTHFTGELNKVFNTKYFVRNMFFEPAYSSEYAWVERTIKKVKICFLLNIPAIVSMHRINFVGGIDEKVQENNLRLFSKLISSLIIEFPDIEFLSTNELTDLI